jgi:hypothetical protein
MSSALLKPKPNLEEEARERANRELKESEKVSEQLEKLRKERGGTFSRTSEKVATRRS